MRASLVIVAAGASSRFGAANKLLEVLGGGKTVLEICIENAWASGTSSELVIAASNDTWVASEAVMKKIGAPGSVVSGGFYRQESVKNALEVCGGEIVIIHDAARPLASKELFAAVFEAASQTTGAAPFLPVPDTVLMRTEAGVLAGNVNRDSLIRTQTPQAFPLKALLGFHLSAETEGRCFSDDASLFLACGAKVSFVPGEEANIKISTNRDLEIVRAIFAARGGGMNCAQ
ncbi:MAG: 2-C-methyl-D-erythritol 4-phosphate cytidylyltransferase [bacterium]